MKYGVMGGFIRVAFEKTALDYMKKTFPEMDMASYQKRVRKEYELVLLL